MKKIIYLLILILLSTSVMASSSWPASSSYTEIGSSLPSDYEVSGLFYNSEMDKIFAVSDNGIISQLNTDGSSITNWRLSGDYEGLTFGKDLTSNYVYIGIENPDSIVEFDRSNGALTGRSWSLTTWMASSSSNLGLEGLTFVPNGYHHYTAGRSGGLFYAALQENGKIYVFDIDTTKTNDVSFVDSFTPVSGRSDLSDLYFDRTTSTLYAIYDSSNNLLEMDSMGNILNDYSAPASDQEGISIITSCPTETAVVLIGQDYGNSILSYVSYPVDCPEVDSDGDLLSDSMEETYGSNPNDPDSDDDGLNDWDEILGYSTNPNDSDTDDGGISDYSEITRDETNPLDSKDDKIFKITWKKIPLPFSNWF